MDDEPSRRGERVIRWATTASVVVLAGIAALVSYAHMYALVLRNGQTSWAAVLSPLSVDGMIVASSMSLLADSRCGRRGGFLPWTLLVVGSTASLVANMAVAGPSPAGRLIAAWPSFALIGSYELLMRQIRHGALQAVSGRPGASYVPDSYQAADEQPSYDAHMTGGDRSEGGGRAVPPHTKFRRTAPALSQQAWEWALEHRTRARTRRAAASGRRLP